MKKVVLIILTVLIQVFAIASFAGGGAKVKELNPKQKLLLKEMIRSNSKIYTKCNSSQADADGMCWVKYYADGQDCSSCSASRGMQETGKDGSCIQELSCSCSGCVSLSAGSGAVQMQTGH